MAAIYLVVLFGFTFIQIPILPIDDCDTTEIPFDARYLILSFLRPVPCLNTQIHIMQIRPFGSEMYIGESDTRRGALWLI